MSVGSSGLRCGVAVIVSMCMLIWMYVSCWVLLWAWAGAGRFKMTCRVTLGVDVSVVYGGGDGGGGAALLPLAYLLDAPEVPLCSPPPPPPVLFSAIDASVRLMLLKLVIL